MYSLYNTYIININFKYLLLNYIFDFVYFKSYIITLCVCSLVLCSCNSHRKSAAMPLIAA